MRSIAVRSWRIGRSRSLPQGSYRNRVNVRKDSDVDVGVMLYEYFLVQYPEGKGSADFNHSDVDYSFSQFKNELEEALVAHFGRAAVKRGNKAFNIRETAYHVEADVAPFWELRQYWENGLYRAGVALRTDRGMRIENYPERLVDYWPSTPLHYENGVSKNDDTSRRFKGVVRILKKIRNEMEEADSSSAKAIPGYLLECMTWNVPNEGFAGPTWDARIHISFVSLSHGHERRPIPLSMRHGAMSESVHHEAGAPSDQCVSCRGSSSLVACSPGPGHGSRMGPFAAFQHGCRISCRRRFRLRSSALAPSLAPQLVCEAAGPPRHLAR